MLVKATARYRGTAVTHEEARAAVVQAILAALRAGIPPTEVAALSPFTGTYVRSLARDAGLPKARPGVKRKET